MSKELTASSYWAALSRLTPAMYLKSTSGGSGVTVAVGSGVGVGSGIAVGSGVAVGSGIGVGSGVAVSAGTAKSTEVGSGAGSGSFEHATAVRDATRMAATRYLVLFI